MPFIFKGKLNDPNGTRVYQERTLADSTAFTIGDAVRLNASGVLELAGAGNTVYGIIAAFIKADGSPVTDNGAGGDYTNTYTTGASNTVQASVDTSYDSKYSVTADATLGTTTGSDLAGYNMDVLAASDQLDESTATANTAQFFSHGQDPDPKAATNSVIVTIQESQIKI